MIKHRIKTLEGAKNKINDQLKSLRVDNDEMRKKISRLDKNRKDELTDLNKDFKSKIFDLEDSIKTKEGIIDKMKNELSELNEAKSKLQKDLDIINDQFKQKFDAFEINAENLRVIEREREKDREEIQNKDLKIREKEDKVLELGKKIEELIEKTKQVSEEKKILNDEHDVNQKLKEM